ncbi:MAG: cell division protein ZapE [Alphaproteobacteria bacterium]|nr:cell division protein ZapE [Rhodospirillales bacterium]MCW9044944.1 cell division protein ZapE [Alphaproteobacteria bacterium]
MQEGPLFHYRTKLADGELKHDPHQALAAEKLQSLHHALEKYKPSTGHSGWKARFGLARPQREEPPQGLYIYGDVGTGKSMIMDLFYDTSHVKKKRRVHFHEFMQEVHNRLNKLRKSKHKEDPIPPLAKQLADEAWLLCFDEFVVDNIADAMILGRLFESLFERDVVVVTTSNRVPTDLYKNGLQRDRFLPFIDLIMRRLDVMELNGGVDYRLGRMSGVKVYHTPANDEAEAALTECFEIVRGESKAAPSYLLVKGRQVDLPLRAGGVARASFLDLCAQPLGPAEFLEIAVQFHTLVLDKIPLLGPENRNEAKRFVTLVDALYEHKVNLVCSASAPPELLYTAGDGAFEFQRTVSRLMEMQSREYVSLPHLT